MAQAGVHEVHRNWEKEQAHAPVLCPEITDLAAGREQRCQPIRGVRRGGRYRRETGFTFLQGAPVVHSTTTGAPIHTDEWFHHDPDEERDGEVADHHRPGRSG
jgi:hypothetical protein